MKKETSDKEKVAYTTAGIRKKSYALVKIISRAVGIKKIDVLSDLIEEMPPEYLADFIERRKKTARIRAIKQVEALNNFVEKFTKGKKKLDEIREKAVSDALRHELIKKKG